MKQFLFFLLSYFICAINIQTASADNREALIDTICVTRIDRSLYDHIINGYKDTDGIEKSHLECAAHFLMSHTFNEKMDCFSDGELEFILKFQRSLSYRYLNSVFFLENLISNFSKALEMESGSKNGFSYRVNDKDYRAIWNEYADFIEPYTDIAKYLNEEDLVDQARENGLQEEQVSLYVSIIRKVFGNLGDLYALSCVDYLSLEDVREMISFIQSPTIRKYLFTLHSLGELISTMDEKDLSLVALEATEERIIDYFELSRSIPHFVPVLFRPVKEFSRGKNVYSGETRDGLPYGKGVLTDKRGQKYSGYFKNGKRHGQFVVKGSDGDTKFQTWVDDRYVKTIPAAPPSNGQIPDVQEYMGKLSGYGRHYDHSSMTYYEGFFIDGELTGTGVKRTVDYEMTGEFRASDQFIGTVVWNDPELSVSRFQGKVYGNIREGSYQGVMADGSMTVTKNGVFVDSMLDGPANVSYSTPEKDVYDEGIYAYGELFGFGSRKIVRKTDSNGISESSAYEGEFFSGYYNGTGRFVTDLTGISPQNWTFTRCGVKIKGINAPSIRIEMTGSFDDGEFIEGRVSVSTGQHKEGRFVSGELYDGKETVVYQDGTRAEYTIKNGVKSDICRIEYSDGSVYEGPIKRQ